MRESLRLAWAIAKVGWLAAYNRSWRFSRIKSALLFNAMQLAFVVFIARRGGEPSPGSPGAWPGSGPAAGGPANVASVPWALARILGFLAPAALGLWIGGGMPGAPRRLPPALPLSVLAAAPVIAIVAGHRLMTRDGWGG